jgi:alpha-acetolactate decarboxylase
MSEIRREKKKNFVGVYRKGINEGIVKRGFYYCCIDNDKDIEGHSLIIVNAKEVIIYKIKKCLGSTNSIVRCINIKPRF